MSEATARSAIRNGPTEGDTFRFTPSSGRVKAIPTAQLDFLHWQTLQTGASVASPALAA